MNEVKSEGYLSSVGHSVVVLLFFAVNSEVSKLSLTFLLNSAVFE